MWSKDRILIITFIVIALAGISGCARIAVDEGELERVKTKYFYDAMGTSGVASGHSLMFDGMRSIRRIVIRSDEPIKNIDIYIRAGEGNWKRVKQIKSPIDAKTPIKIFARGDAIRVIQKTINVGLIQDIEVFATPNSD